MTIEICENNTNVTGEYKVCFTNNYGQRVCRRHSEEDIYEILTPTQYKRFEEGESNFNVPQKEFDRLGIEM